MYRTTREFSGLLKQILGVSSSNECWYLVVYLYACFGVRLSLENPARSIFKKGNLWEIVDYKDKRFLDLLFFSKKHVGLVLDDTYFIHASDTVIIEKFAKNILLVPKVKVYRLWH